MIRGDGWIAVALDLPFSDITIIISHEGNEFKYA
jgi:hypothetical protein